MTTTFAARLTGSDGRDLRLAVVIQGVPVVFQQGRVDLPDAVVALAGYGDGSGHARYKSVGKIEQAAKELDLQQRRMVGGMLKVDLLDDAAGTLRALFSPRRRRGTYLVADVDDDPSNDTLQVDNAAGVGTINVSTTVYIGGETIGFAIPDNAPTPDEIVGTRGSFGSEPQAHFGAADNGSNVYLTPPSWVGRRVKLIGYFENPDGTTTASLATVLDTFRIEKAPAFVGGASWTIEASHLSDEFAKRKLGTGLRQVPSTAARSRVSSTQASYQARDGDREQFVVGAVDTYVRVRGKSREQVRFDGITIDRTEGGDAAGVHRLVSQVGSDVTVDTTANLVQNGGVVDEPADLRHIAILPDATDVGTAVVRALTSRLGDAANGANDVLPGRKRTGFGDTDWRFGAGILAAEVDTAAFVDVGGDAGGWRFVIDDEIDAVDFLRDFCIVTDSFWLADSDGKLTVKRLSEERADAVMALDDNVIIGEPSVEYVEDDISPRVRLKCNWDTVSEEFQATFNLIDSELADRYPDHDERIDIESRGVVVGDFVQNGQLGVGGGASFSVGTVETMLRTLQKAGDRGRIFISATCHLDALVLDLGDVVTITVDVPDLEGNLLAARTARVLRLGPKTDEGTVDVVVEVVEALYSIAPAAVLTAAVGTTVTLEASKDGTSKPARMFAAGWGVEQRSSAGVLINDFIVVAVLNDTQLQLDSAPTITANSDFLCSAEQAFADISAAENTDGYGLRDFTYQMPDSEASIVAGSTTINKANSATRWR